MKIELQSLRAINCGPLRDDCIHFTPGERGVTVLAGANGSGKTTVLYLILGLVEQLAPFSELPPYRLTLSKSSYAQMDLLIDGKRFSIFHGQQPKDVKLPDDFFGRSGEIGEVSNEMKGDVALFLREQIKQQETRDVSSLQSLPDNTVLPSFLLFPHTRFIMPLSGEQINRETISYQWSYLGQIAFEFKGSLSSYLIWLDNAEPETFAHVITFLNELDFDGKTFGVVRKELQVVVTTRDGQTHDVAALSSGEQNLLILLLELRRRLLPHSIVLIDEIENSLHPAFQKRLAEALKRMQEQTPFQLIVTTHALPIVEAFGPASTRILTEF